MSVLLSNSTSTVNSAPHMHTSHHLNFATSSRSLLALYISLFVLNSWQLVRLRTMKVGGNAFRAEIFRKNSRSTLLFEGEF